MPEVITMIYANMLYFVDLSLQIARLGFSSRVPTISFPAIESYWPASVIGRSISLEIELNERLDYFTAFPVLPAQNPLTTEPNFLSICRPPNPLFERFMRKRGSPLRGNVRPRRDASRKRAALLNLLGLGRLFLRLLRLPCRGLSRRMLSIKFRLIPG